MSNIKNKIIRLPKSVYLTINSKYAVGMKVKKDAKCDSKQKQVHVGVYDTIEEAVKARDKFVIDNYDGITKGYMPRGIHYNKRQQNYTANLSIRGKTFYIGCFTTMQEAIDTRAEFIDSLK